MNEVQKNLLNQISEICRKNGETLESLLMSALEDQKIKQPKQCKESIEIRITNLLKQIGVPAHLKGYRYIRYSIIYAMENKKALDSITKILYPVVAKRFQTTSSRVERAIRHAIEVAWSRGDIEFMEECFGYTIDQDRGKPTNSEFIATLVNYLEIS